MTNQDSPSIQLEGVGKRYWKLEERAMLLRSLLPFARPTRTEFWALRGVDVTVAEGEAIGLIGHNGAGKTSLLRLMAGVSRPTEGRVQVRGRIAPLISVGVGFQREMSGRENIYLNGMLLGLTYDEVTERLEDIIAFAELAEFIDTPVKFYSSGMFMRLGFAAAIHVEPRVLLVDEVLAVGDIGFQMRCFRRMQEVQKAGTTIVLASHSVGAIRLLCRRTIVLRAGRVEFDGDVEDGISIYHELLGEDQANGPASSGGATAVSLVSRQLLGEVGPTRHVACGEQLRLIVRFRFNAAVTNPHFIFSVFNEQGIQAYELRSLLADEWRSFSAGEEADIEVSFRAQLTGGTYVIRLSALAADGLSPLYVDRAGTLVYVAHQLGVFGVADLGTSMTVDGHVVSDHRPITLAEPTAEDFE